MTADYALLIQPMIVLYTYLTYFIYACIGLWFGISLYLIWNGK